MSAHSSSPWRLFLGGNGSFVIEDANRIAVLCQRTPWAHRAAESEANARLIAAAPDLLRALRALRSLVREGGVPRYTITPGAALNSIIEEMVDPAIAAAESQP